MLSGSAVIGIFPRGLPAAFLSRTSGLFQLGGAGCTSIHHVT